MSSVDKSVDSDPKALLSSKMVALKGYSKDKSFEENMDEFYDILISEDGTELFACKYDNCPNLEKTESDIFSHLRQHFFDEIPSNTVDLNLSQQSADKLKTCKKEVDSDVECIDISDDDTVESKPKNMLNNTLVSNPAVNSLNDRNKEWEQFVGIGFEAGSQVFHCRFSDECHFKTNLRMKIKTHINKHSVEPKVSPKKEFNEYEFWGQCLNDVFNHQNAALNQTPEPLAESTPKPRTASSSSSKLKSSLRSKSQNKKSNTSGVKPQPNSFFENPYETKSMPQTPNTSGLIDINFNHNNTILSLKGMASVKKLEMFIKCRVINGLKYFCCNFNTKCGFKSKRSQETANHVHCAHLGFYLECVRPDCDKVFRTPGSWREHQKNHICNFGLYGYQRGVTGVCRNSHLLNFQEKLIVENNNKAYKCKWKGCGFVTRQRTACKRHIHNSHVCPYRKNKQWKKELLKFMEIKSHMTDKPIPVEIKNERTFYCSRPQCQAELANETDLYRHESHFCKYRTTVKSVKNGQNGRNTAPKEKEKPKAVARLVFSSPVPSTSGLNDSRNESHDSNKNHKSETELIRENGHKHERRRDYNDCNDAQQTNGENLNMEAAIKAKCDKFIKKELYDGIHYILCNAPNCKYTTKKEEKIYEHIQKTHSLVSPRQTSTSAQSVPHLRKRSQSSVDSNETIVSKKSKSSTDNNHQNQRSQNKKIPQNSSQKIPQNSTQNSSQMSSKKTQKVSKNLAQKSNNSDLNNKYNDYYKVKRIESEPFYFCEYPSSECRFYSPTRSELFDHISQTHIVYKCDISDCKRQFKTQSLLEVHKRNHICGFGITGRKATGVCALENVRKYRRELLVDGLYRYDCKVCKFSSQIKSAVLSHAHNRHIHPPPPPQ